MVPRTLSRERDGAGDGFGSREVTEIVRVEPPLWADGAVTEEHKWSVQEVVDSG